MECYCFVRCVHDKMTDGKTAFEKICCQQFDGPTIPVEHPITEEDRSRVHQFGKYVDVMKQTQTSVNNVSGNTINGSEAKTEYIAEWSEERAKLQAVRHNKRIFEVLTDDNELFKVSAHARQKLERETALPLPCIEEDDRRRKLQAGATSIYAKEDSQIQKIQEQTRK